MISFFSCSHYYTDRKFVQSLVRGFFLCLAETFHAGGVQTLTLDEGLELLRDGLFNIISTGSLRNHNVHLGRLRAHDFDTQRVCRKIHLASISLVNGNRWNFSEDLHLHALAVDELGGRHQRVEDQRALLARVHDDAVDLALDLQGGVFTPEHVHDVVHFGILDHQIAVALLVLDQPLLAVANE